LREGDGPILNWATQRIDHFNPQDTRTFQQRYWINDTFWKAPDGPVFLMLGGESTANPIWATTGTWVTAAQQLGALLVLTEHRYYGLSQPFPDLDTPNLQYLTSEQSLADHAALHSLVSSSYNLTSSNKWVCFGGSYSGALSAWFRLKYPALVVGAIASSAPVYAEVDYTQYLEVVTASLQTSTHGPQCTAAISNATSQIQSLLQSPQGVQRLSQLFYLCAPPQGDNDAANFIATAGGAFMGVVQYNGDNRAFEGAPNTNITVQVVCDMMVSGSDPVAAYAAVSNLVNGAGPSSCLDISYADMISFLQNTSTQAPAAEGGRQWTYQTCAEFAYFQSTDSANQVFGSLIPVSWYIQQCVDIFGPQFNATAIAGNVAWTNTVYGGRDVEGSEIVFPNGSIDPWHALGIVTDISPSEPAVFIQGTAHCADMYPASPSDLPALVAARQQVIQQLYKWVGQ